MKYEESENLLFSFLSSSWSNSLRFLRTAWSRQLRDNKWATKWCYKSGHVEAAEVSVDWKLEVTISGVNSADGNWSSIGGRNFYGANPSLLSSAWCERIWERVMCKPGSMKTPSRENYFHEKLRQARRKKKHINPRNEIILRVFWGSEEGKLSSHIPKAFCVLSSLFRVARLGPRVKTKRESTRKRAGDENWSLCWLCQVEIEGEQWECKDGRFYNLWLCLWITREIQQS